MRLRLLLATIVLSLLPIPTRADTLFTFRGPVLDPRESNGVYADGLSYISGSLITTTKILPEMTFVPSM